MDTIEASAKLVSQAKADAKAYQQRTGCGDEQRLAFECGVLGSFVRELMGELQLALNETCNQYHMDGHADRVKAQYGLEMQEAA